ncbi:MAG TPA: DHA2 family efflux MFS transporter permease subunit [Burkholderiales bacterium]|nr:DHA2 family efflux MFS transporter permease subunit [Burkholderiales bacterium]
MTPPGHSARSEAPPDPRRWLGLAGIGSGVFMFTLDGSIVNVALPTLAQVFGAPLAAVQWVVLAYLLVITTLVLGAARLGDVHGRKRAYMFGLGLFTASSVLCGLAPSVHWLIAFRALQGFGAVFVSALGGAIVAQTFPQNERGRALGVISSCVTLGVALGPTIGAFIIHLVGWRWMFLVNIPVGLAAMAIVSRVIPDLPPHPTRLRFDWLGTLLIALALGSFSLALTFGQRQGFGSALPDTLFVVAAGALIAFLVSQTMVDAPVLDLKMFVNRPFSAGLTMSVLAFIVLGSTAFTTPFFLQLGVGLPIATVGLLMGISPILGAVVGPIGGTLSDKFGPRWTSFIGLSLMTVGCLRLAMLDETMSIASFALSVAPVGIGMALFSSSNNSAVLGSVARERLGIASGMLSLVRTLGQSTGIPIAAALFAVFALGHAGVVNSEALFTLPASALVRGTRYAFGFAALAAFCGACLALWMLVTDRTKVQAAARGSSKGASKR